MSKEGWLAKQMQEASEKFAALPEWEQRALKREVERSKRRTDERREAAG